MFASLREARRLTKVLLQHHWNPENRVVAITEPLAFSLGVIRTIWVLDSPAKAHQLGVGVAAWTCGGLLFSPVKAVLDADFTVLENPPPHLLDSFEALMTFEVSGSHEPASELRTGGIDSTIPCAVRSVHGQ